MQNKPDQKLQEPVEQRVEANVQTAVQGAQQEVERGRVPWYRASKRAQVLIGIYLLLFLLFLVLATFVYFHPIIPVDIAITREFQENHTPWLEALMAAVSYLGNIPLLFSLLVLLAAAAFWMVRLRLEAAYIVCLSLVSAILNGAIKLLVNRPRPQASLVEVLQHATGQSFPSGHVMSYVAFWGLLFSLGLILFKRDRWWQYTLLIVPALFVVLVGPSRIYLGDHWASDVVGAYMLGGLLLGVSLWIYLDLKKRGVLAPKDRRPMDAITEPPSIPQQEHAAR